MLVATHPYGWQHKPWISTSSITSKYSYYCSIYSYRHYIKTPKANGTWCWHITGTY